MQLPLLQRLSGALVIVLSGVLISATAASAVDTTPVVPPVVVVPTTTAISIDGGIRNTKTYEYGDVHVFNATVTVSPTTAAAGGTVTWTDTVANSVILTKTTAVVGNTTSLNYVPGVGVHNVTAHYNGDNGFPASDTSATFTVVKNGVTGTLAATLSPFNGGTTTPYGGTFTLNSNVATDVDGTQDASVVKYLGTVTVSFNGLALATYNAANYPLGATFDFDFQAGISYKLHIKYTGDVNNNGFDSDQTLTFDKLTPPTPLAQPVPAVDKTAVVNSSVVLTANDFDHSVTYQVAPAGYVNVKDETGTQVARFLINSFSWKSPAPFKFTKVGRTCLTAQWEGDAHYGFGSQAANDLGCWNVTAAAVVAPPVTTAPVAGTTQSLPTVGYRLLASDGGIFTFGKASFLGSGGADVQSFKVVASASKKDGSGYWMVRSNGAVSAYGSAVNYGDRSGYSGSPIVAMAATASGNGYWLVAADGGIFTFGDAQYYGSTGGTKLNAPVIAMSATTSGAGYWLIGKDGGIFSFGDAKFYGSMGGQKLNAPVITMAPTASGNGYWLVGADGGIFSFGDAQFYGSTGDISLNAPVIAMSSTLTGKGYWLVGADGGIFSFGDAPFLGSTGDQKLNAPVIGISPA